MKNYKLVYKINNEEVSLKAFYERLKRWCVDIKKFNSFKRQLLSGTTFILGGSFGGVYKIERVKKGGEK